MELSVNTQLACVWKEDKTLFGFWTTEPDNNQPGKSYAKFRRIIRHNGGPRYFSSIDLGHAYSYDI